MIDELIEVPEDVRKRELIQRKIIVNPAGSGRSRVAVPIIFCSAIPPPVRPRAPSIPQTFGLSSQRKTFGHRNHLRLLRNNTRSENPLETFGAAIAIFAVESHIPELAAIGGTLQDSAKGRQVADKIRSIPGGPRSPRQARPPTSLNRSFRVLGIFTLKTYRLDPGKLHSFNRNATG